MSPTSQKSLCGQRLVATNLNRLLFSPTRTLRPLIYSYTLEISKRKIGHLMLEHFMILYIHCLCFPSESLWECWQEIVCYVKHDLLDKLRSPVCQFQRENFSCRELGRMGSWGKEGLVSSFKCSSPSASLSACCLLFSVNPTWNLGAGKAELWVRCTV